MRIDKSLFSAEELATWNALIAKGKVDPEAGAEEMEEEMPPAVPPKKTEKAEGVEDNMEKSASPELTAALEQLEDLKKSIEMKEFTEVAKKYAPLGKNENELAQTLYDMKKSNEANYDAYVKILDESLGLVEKSGLFVEVGKSTSGSPVSGAEAKAEAKANEIMKSNPEMDYTTAIAKAWEDPSIMAEYDSEYFG